MTEKSTDSYWNNCKRKAYKHKYCEDSLITYLSIVQQIFIATHVTFFLSEVDRLRFNIKKLKF